MRRSLFVTLASVVALLPAWPHHGAGECGTTRETIHESLFAHRQRVRSRLRPSLNAAQSANQDIGDIAIIHDQDGVVDRLNQFDLDGASLTFSPFGSGYQFRFAPQGYDAPAAASGAPLAALGDDDSRAVDLPFPFPFFGVTYNRVFVNSDGNLTFTAGENASTQRSLGRMTAGPPRISPLFDDLNPAQTAGGVRVLRDASRVVVSWVNVPEYSDSNSGLAQTFQAALFPDGRIEFAYSGVQPSSAVVGIAPGSLQGATAVLDFRADPGSTYAGTVAEVFGNLLTVDVVTVAQQFYRSHEDAYDYLVIYNNIDVPALGEGTVAYEQTVRNAASGFGVPVFDVGSEFGSPSRLQAVLNLGPLSQYPADPNALVPARAPQMDTPLTILAHETGHRFLAYASVAGASASSPPMLGFQLAHWSFLFDSEASVLEGERIQDRGATANPEFLTTDLAQAYAPLDQYLMGFRPPSQVPDTFVVENPTPNYPATLHPYSGIAFNGARRDIHMDDLIGAMGRRTPDDTVAQRHFRFGFILVAADGAQPSADDLAKLDGFRRQFLSFFGQASSTRAAADATLRRNLQLSLSPAAGVAKGTTVLASVTVATPPASDLTVQLAAPNGAAKFPASVTIPAGRTAIAFQASGVNSGVEEVQAIPSDPLYETAFARVQVGGDEILQLTAQLEPGNHVLARLTDANGLPYAGATLIAIPSADGAVVPSDAVTDAQGAALFRWSPGPNPVNQLQLMLSGLASVHAMVAAGSAVPSIASVVNAASLTTDIAPGSLVSILGAHFNGADLALNGAPAIPLSRSDSRMLLVLPPDIGLGPATLTLTLPSGLQTSALAPVAALAPGIFPGGIRQTGNVVEIYCTGLGATQPAGSLQRTVFTPTVFIGATPLQPVFSGLAPGYPGLYQVDVQLPAGVPRGLQSFLLSVNNTHSNSIDFTVQ